MKIYTKTGDKGETGILGGHRVSKNDLVIHAVGEVDETNSHLGLVRSYELGTDLSDLLCEIQSGLFVIGSIIANCKSGEQDAVTISDENVAVLEQAIDNFDAGLPAMNSFILPGGTKTGAHLHVARCVCRRAERSVVNLIQHGEPVSDLSRVTIYLNRLSDLLFVMARRVNLEAQCPEINWLPDKPVVGSKH